MSNFGYALESLKEGHAVRRSGWNASQQYIKLQVPDENSKMTLPYIYISTVQGQNVPWLASQTDLLAEDWEDDFYDEGLRELVLSRERGSEYRGPVA